MRGQPKPKEIRQLRKRHLQKFCGHPRFRQQLVPESGVALQDLAKSPKNARGGLIVPLKLLSAPILIESLNII